jgi:hypothetical protein
MTIVTVKKLPAATQRKLDGCAKAIRRETKKSIQALFEIGRQLKVAHDALANHGDGTFGEWCQKSCGINRTTAHRQMQLIERLDEKKLLNCCTDQRTFTDSALYYLAREATPEVARQDALKFAAKGERITLIRAKAIVSEKDGGKFTTIKRKAVVTRSISSGIEWDDDVVTTIRTDIRRHWRSCPRGKRREFLKALRDMVAELSKGTTKRRDEPMTLPMRRTK